MSLQVYQILHMGGFACLFLALGGMAVHAMSQVATPTAEGAESPEPAPRPKVLAALHGIGLAILLVAGFGAMAKLGIKAPPLWIWAKIGIWIFLGAAPVILKRLPHLAKGALFALPLIALAVAALAFLRPGG